MVQVVYNGVVIGKLTEANVKVYLNLMTGTVVAQTENTICVKG